MEGRAKDEDEEWNDLTYQQAAAEAGELQAENELVSAAHRRTVARAAAELRRASEQHMPRKRSIEDSLALTAAMKVRATAERSTAPPAPPALPQHRRGHEGSQPSSVCLWHPAASCCTAH